MRRLLEDQYGGYLSKSAAVRHLIDLGLRAIEAKKGGLATPVTRSETAQFRLAEVSPAAANRFTVEYRDTVVETGKEFLPECESGAFVAYTVPSDDLAPEYRVGDVALLELGAEPAQRSKVVAVFDGEIMAREWLATPRGIILGATNQEVFPIPVPRPMDVRVVGVLGKVVSRAEEPA